MNSYPTLTAATNRAEHSVCFVLEREERMGQSCVSKIGRCKSEMDQPEFALVGHMFDHMSSLQ